MKDDDDADLADDTPLEADQNKRETVDLAASSSSSSSSSSPLSVKVGHHLRLHEITLPAQATFGDLKSILTPLTGLHPNEQRLLFKGKQKEDGDFLHSAGVKNNSKISLLENASSKDRRLEEARQNECLEKAFQAVALVREEIDKIAAQVTSLETTVESGTKVPDTMFAMLSELLMRQLLKLDSIEAEGDAKVQRKAEVQRAQRFADIVDQLKVKNSDPLYSSQALVVSLGSQEETNATSRSASLSSSL